MKYSIKKLKDISVNVKGEYGIGASAVTYSHNLPTYLRITDINEDGTLDYPNMKSLNDINYKKYILFDNDIVFARTGNSTGKNYYYDSADGELVYAGFLIKFSLDPDKVVPKYIKYYCMSNSYWGWVNGFSTGSTRGNINAKTYGNLEIPLPPISYQRATVYTLETLENKIKLNNQIISTLVELASTLFKRWFVDFEFPDKNGNPYKSSGGKMITSELGDIPEGWEVSNLTSVANYKNGLAMQKFRPTGEESLPVLKIKELNQGFTDSNSDKCDIDIRDDVKVYDGDVIFSWSGTLLMKLWTGGKAGLNQHLFKVTSDKYYKWFYYLWTKYYLRSFIEIAKDKATTMGHIKRQHLEEAVVLVPNIELLENLNEVLSPIIDMIVKKGLEISNIETMRDNLLPKLLSGEIEISDAEEIKQ